MIFLCPSPLPPPPLLPLLCFARPMASYKCSTADRPYRRRRPADVLPSPVPRPSYDIVVQTQFVFFCACGALFSVLLLHSSFPFVRLFRSYFVPLFLSSDFSVPLLFLFSALQTFPFLFVPLFRSSDFSARISFLFSVLLSARHFLDGGVFRSIGNFFM